MGYTYQTVFPRVILEAIRTLDKRSGNETMALHTTNLLVSTQYSRAMDLTSQEVCWD